MRRSVISKFINFINKLSLFTMLHYYADSLFMRARATRFDFGIDD